MANGPFGNPLSTGIALSFEVDMTPYREMHKRKLLAAKEKEEDQKKKQQQYADILKNITPPDASKIHKKYMPEVQNQYAELIDSAMGYINKNDMASLHKHMFGFKSNAEKAVQATENYKNYVNSDANKTFKSIEAIRSMEDDNTSIGDIFDKYQNDVEYGDGYLFWSTIERPDVLGNANKVLQGTEKMFMTDDAGNYISTGKVGPRGKELYRKSIKDPDKFFENQATLLKNSAGGNRLLMEYGGIKASQLDERQADGRQLRDVLADRLVRETLSPKVYGEEGLDPNVPRADKTDYTRPGVMGKVQIAEAQTTPISREAFNINEYKSGAQPVIESKVLEILKQQGSNNEKGVKAELENLLQKLVIVEDVNDYFSDENLISVAAAVGEDTYGTPVEIDLNDQAAAAKKIAEVLSGASDENLKAIGNNIGFEYAAPSSVIKDFEKTAQVSTFGGDVRKSYEMPKGEIYMVGSKGAQVVKIRNGINVAGSLFKSFNRDKDGEIWHGIDFPVEEQSAITSLLEQALGRESIDDFIKSNGIPKTFYVPETQKNVATFLTTDSQGKLTPEFLDAELKKIGVYGSGTQSSGSSGEEEVDEFGFPIEN